MNEQKDFSVMSIADAEVEIAFYRDQMRRAKLGLPVFETRVPSAHEEELKTLRAEMKSLFQQALGTQQKLRDLAGNIDELTLALTSMHSRMSRMSKGAA